LIRKITPRRHRAWPPVKRDADADHSHYAVPVGHLAEILARSQGPEAQM
jgi:hypothetical protein